MEPLSELINLIKEASPLVWQSLIKQAYIEGVSHLLWGVGLAILCPILVKLAGPPPKFGERDIPEIFALFGAWASAILSLIFLSSAIQHLINPEFYAIRFIVQGLGGG